MCPRYVFAQEALGGLGPLKVMQPLEHSMDKKYMHIVRRLDLKHVPKAFVSLLAPDGEWFKSPGKEVPPTFTVDPDILWSDMLHAPRICSHQTIGRACCRSFEPRPAVPSPP